MIVFGRIINIVDLIFFFGVTPDFGATPGLANLVKRTKYEKRKLD